jgi:hypothetical protein
MHASENVVVIENEPAILRRWQQGAREFGVSFIPDTPSAENALAAIQSAISPLRGLSDPKKRISVIETLEDYAFLLYPAGNRAGISAILREVAQALGDAGFRGKLRGAHEVLAKHDSDVVPSFNAVLCNTGAVVRMGEPPDFVSSPPPGGSYWEVGSPEFASLVRQCLDWARETSDGRYLLSSGMLSVFCREDQAAKFLTEACANVGAAVLEVLSADGELLRAAFGLDGYLLLSSPSTNVPWERGLHEITRRITRAASLIDYGLIRRSYYEASSIEQTINFGHPQPEHLGSGLHTNHFALKTHVNGHYVLPMGGQLMCPLVASKTAR